MPCHSIISTIHIFVGPHEQDVVFTHIHYLGWPDFGAPTETKPIISMVKDVRKIIHESMKSKKEKINIVVHCSAGVGRTGTFIALYQFMERLDYLVPLYQRGGIYKNRTIDIFNSCFNLRSKRVFMVIIFHFLLNTYMNCYNCSSY